MKKTLFVLIVIALVTGFTGWRFFLTGEPGSRSTPDRGARIIPVEVTPIEHGSIRDIAQFTGTLRPYSRFVVSPKIPGLLEGVRVNIGDPVENGDLIAVLDSEEYVLAVTQAEAELAVSRSNLVDSKSTMTVAARELERVEELHVQRVASDSELDSTEAKYNAAVAGYEMAKAGIQQREAALESARVRLSYTRIHARWSRGGSERIVSEKFIDEGNMLRANDPIVSIVDVGTVVARIHVIERDYPAIMVGQRAIVTTDAYPGRQFEGRVVRRAPVLTEETRQAVVEVEIPNPEMLLAPGMYIRSSIEFSRKEDAVIVPASALVNRHGRKGVFVFDEEAQGVVFNTVETGIIEGNRVEITTPRIAGKVVTLGQHLLEDGVAVRISNNMDGL